MKRSEETQSIHCQKPKTNIRELLLDLKDCCDLCITFLLVFAAPYHFVLWFSSDRTVKIWRARGGLDSTFEAVDNADEVASN